MKHRRILIINSLLLVLTLLVAACGRAPTTETELPDTKDAIKEQQIITQIVIDGKLDDWSGYQISGEDPSGDHHAGTPDIKNLRAFSNDSYLYMFIEFYELGGYDHFYFNITTESNTDYQLTLFNDGGAQIENKSTYKITPIMAILAVDSGYEFKIPLSAVNDEKIKTIYANVWLGTGNGDRAFSSILFNVDEIESLIQPGSLKEISTRPAHFQLASGAKGDYTYRSFLQVPIDMTIGPDGNLYVADSPGKHIVRVSPEGEMDDLGLWKTVEALQVDGPRSVAFDSKGILYIANHSKIFRYDIEKDYLEELAGIIGSPIGCIVFDKNDNLYYTDRGENLIRKWDENGESEKFFTTETNIDDDLVFDDEGFLYLIAKDEETQMKGLLKVNLSTGEEIEFEKILHSGDIIYIDVDNEGDIWVRGGSNRLYQFAPNGDVKPFTMNGVLIDNGDIGIGCGAGVAVDEEGGVWVADYSSKLIYLEPEVLGGVDPEFISKAVSPGFVTKSIALGPNGEIYTFNQNTREVWKIDSNGEIEILKALNDVDRIEIVVSDDGEIYLALRNKNEVVILEDDGSLTHVADVSVNSMTLGADGKLYATTSGKPYAVVQISGIDDYKTFAIELAGDPIGTWETEITPAMDKGLYILTVDNENIYFLDFEGNSELVKNVKEQMAWVMGASPTDGKLYFISHFEVGYHMARMDTDGNIDEYGYNFGGDPWAMVVSDDGKWLYVGSSGVISKVPLQD